MKKLKFVGRLTAVESLPCSYYGNPAYRGTFTANNGDMLTGRTASNAACAYGFRNSPELPREITYHYTRTGNVIFDYIRILKEEA